MGWAAVITFISNLVEWKPSCVVLNGGGPLAFVVVSIVELHGILALKIPT